MVFHDQEKDISNDLIRLDERFKYMGLEDFCVHAGPIIRMENEHKFNDIENRKIISSVKYDYKNPKLGVSQY